MPHNTNGQLTQKANLPQSEQTKSAALDKANAALLKQSP